MNLSASNDGQSRTRSLLPHRPILYLSGDLGEIISAHQPPRPSQRLVAVVAQMSLKGAITLLSIDGMRRRSTNKQQQQKERRAALKVCKNKMFHVCSSSVRIRSQGEADLAMDLIKISNPSSGWPMCSELSDSWTWVSLKVWETRTWFGDSVTSFPEIPEVSEKIASKIDSRRD